MYKSVVTGYLICFLSIVTSELSGQNSSRYSYTKGRVTQNETNTPVCFADITCSNQAFYTKSNSRGEFILDQIEYPATLKIRKFGFKDKTVILSDPADPVLIPLQALEIHGNRLSIKNTLQYSIIFKRALEKIRIGGNSGSSDKSQRKLVYCSITSAVDSTARSLFESYAHMNINKYTLQIAHPDISRYVTSDEYVPGLSEGKLYFNIDPYINLPIFPEKYITLKRYLVQDGKQIAMVRFDMGKTRNVYYINIADTSIVFITSNLKPGKRNKIPGGLPVWQDDKTVSTEISFANSPENPGDYFIDYAATNEQYRLIQRNMPDQTVTRKTFFAVVPDSSRIYNAVSSQVAHEALTGVKRQINFNEKVFLTGKYTPFRSETEKLLMKPYRGDFWIHNSYMAQDSRQQRQIRDWDNNNMFYSEDHHTNGNAAESIGPDSLVKEMNNNLVAIENVYLETDRTDYLAGDTIWFSAFVLDNLHMDSTSLSKILYVDLINADNKPEKHLKLFISSGRTKGDIALNKDLKNGLYRLRAYTQYMRNFQGEYLFEKDIPVHRSNFKDLVVVDPVINKSSFGDSIDLYLHSILPDEYQATEKKLEVFVRLNDTVSVKRTFNFNRDFKGSMGFFVPSSLNCSSADIKLTLSDRTIISEQRLSLQLKSGIDLQFFPESGKMVAGIPTVIAYKALDNKGNPTEFSADIVDQDQHRVIHINGNESGLGKFEFTPELNHFYKARVGSLGSKYVFDLPVVEPKGYVLNFAVDSDEIVIKNNQSYFKSRYYLLLTLRGAVYASMNLILDTNTLHINLPLEKYPKGIMQVTLYDSLFRPLAERLIFNNRADQKMLIHVETDKDEYRYRERVRMKINVTDAAGDPVESSFALSVIDASETDSTRNSPDIESYLYLTSELKGRVDYRLLNLSDTTLYGKRNIDLVMMTQGWRNYLWNSIRYARVLEMLYPIEKGFSINGTVFNYYNQKSCSDHTLNYFDLKTGFNGFAGIDQDNSFSIDIPLFYDSHVIFIQNRNKRDRVDKLGYVLDTLPLPGIAYRNNELPYNKYKAGYLKSLEKRFTEADSAIREDIKYIKLGEVTVKAKSHPMYSNPDITINLEKKDPTGKKYSSIFQMIYSEFGEKAFTATGFGTKGTMHMPILVVNGDILTAGSCPPCYDPIYYPWALSIPVNEVSDVKFYEAESKFSQWITPTPPGQKWKYDLLGHKLYLLPTDPKIYLPVVSFKTYSNSYRGNPRGAIMFTYQGLYKAREFYQPDYENKNIQTSDNRTTIYWNPEVKTDSSGTAHVSFYNSDLRGKALIRISGVSYTLEDASSVVSQYLSK